MQCDQRCRHRNVDLKSQAARHRSRSDESSTTYDGSSGIAVNFHRDRHRPCPTSEQELRRRRGGKVLQVEAARIERAEVDAASSSSIPFRRGSTVRRLSNDCSATGSSSENSDVFGKRQSIFVRHAPRPSVRPSVRPFSWPPCTVWSDNRMVIADEWVGLRRRTSYHRPCAARKQPEELRRFVGIIMKYRIESVRCYL
jgi:hypothetical protein